ncbi:unnamed protein product [Malus baccata var. baccata]
MSRVEKAITSTLARAPIRFSRSWTNFINEIKVDQNVLFDLILEWLRLSILQQLHQKRVFPVWLKFVPGISFRTDNEPFKYNI